MAEPHRRCPKRPGTALETDVPAPMSRVLVDTHCHVHISLPGDAETDEAGCCTNEGGVAQKHLSSSSTRAEGGRDEPVGDEVYDSSVDEGKGKMASVPLPEVLHVTMGIKEDDWLGAVHFAANHDLGDHLR